MTKKLLSVGQCNADQTRIADLIEQYFDVNIQTADSHDQAMQLIKQERFDLILVNRILDHTGSDGMDIVRQLASPKLALQGKVMLVSNFANAQEEAIAAGAVRGFGKASLSDSDTIRKLSQFLGD